MKTRFIEQHAIKIIALISSVSTAHRVLLIRGDLPFVRHTDEVVNMNVVLLMLGRRTANPNFFNYPSLWFYLQSLVQVLYQSVRSLMNLAWISPGEIQTITFGVTRVEDVGQFLVARLLSVILGLLLTLSAAWLSYLVSHDRRVAVVTTLLVSVSPTIIYSSVVATPDILASLGAVLFLCGAVLLLQRPNTRVMIFTGVALGITVASKYNGLVIGLALIIPVIFRKLSFKKLQIIIFVTGISFLVLAPFTILDFEQFFDGLSGEIQHYRSGHIGAEGESLKTNLRWLYNSIGPITFFFAATLLSSARKQSLVVFAAVIGLLALLSMSVVRFERNLMPIYAPFFAIVAFGVVLVFDWLKQARLKFGLVCFCLAALVFPLSTVKDLTSDIFQDNVEESRDWLEKNARLGDRIILDVYSPFLDPKKYQVSTDRNILTNLDVLLKNKPHYIVLSKSGSFRQMDLKRSSTKSSLAKLESESCRQEQFDDRETFVFQLRC